MKALKIENIQWQSRPADKPKRVVQGPFGVAWMPLTDSQAEELGLPRMCIIDVDDGLSADEQSRQASSYLNSRYSHKVYSFTIPLD